MSRVLVMARWVSRWMRWAAASPTANHFCMRGKWSHDSATISHVICAATS